MPDTTPTTARFTIVNNDFVPSEKATLPVTDLALQRGYGIFDFLRALNFKPVFIEDHLDRFYRSATNLYLQIPYTRDELKGIIAGLIERNGIKNSGIKLLLTGGNSPDGYSMGIPNLVITQSELTGSSENLEQGLHLASYNYQRQVPGVKTIDYLHAIYLQSFIKAQGADDLLYHHDGVVRESPRANFFMVKGNQVLTPAGDILHGITRKKILGLKLDNYEIVEKDFTMDDLATADEAFVTSTTRIAFPVTRVDKQPIGTGKPGAATLLIRQKINELVAIDQKE